MVITTSKSSLSRFLLPHDLKILCATPSEIEKLMEPFIYPEMPRVFRYLFIFVFARFPTSLMIMVSPSRRSVF